MRALASIETIGRGMALAATAGATSLVSTAALAAAEGEAPVTPFAGTIYQAIAAAIVFGVVLLVLKSKAWGPILKGIQDRENKISGDIQAADAARVEADALVAEYKAKLADAQKEYQQVVDGARKDAQQVAASLKADAEKEIGDLKARATAEIEAAKAQALTEIYEQAATLATDVAGKILQREVSADEHQALVQESLAKLN